MTLDFSLFSFENYLSDNKVYNGRNFMVYCQLLIVTFILLSEESFLNPMCYFLLTSKAMWLFSKKSSSIYKFSRKYDVYYIGCTRQRLYIRIDQHILSNFHTNTYNYTAALRNQKSSSAIARLQLDNPVCSAVHKPTTFTILANSNNELQLSILEALLYNEA